MKRKTISQFLEKGKQNHQSVAHGQQTGPANAAHVGRSRALATLQKGPCANGELTNGPHHYFPFSLPFHLAPWISSNSYREAPSGGARNDATSSSIPRSCAGNWDPP